MKIEKHTLDSLSSGKISQLIGNSFFGSHGFAKLWETIGGEPIYWTVQEEKSITEKKETELLAVMPSVQFGKKPLARIQSMPDGCYGKIFYDCEENMQDEIQKKMFSELINQGYQKIFFYDYLNNLNLPQKYQRENKSVQIVDISREDWMPPDSKLASQIKKSKESRMSVRNFNLDTDMEMFLELVKLTAQRHSQKVRYPREFYIVLAELAKSDDRVIWLFAECDGRAVASHIRFIEGNSCLNWQAYSDKSFSDLFANQYLIYQLAAVLRQRGIKKMNLGASPAGAESLEKYKERWGGQEYVYDCFYYKSILGKLF